MRSDKKIALAGNPNCGKTSLFNALTGLNQQVGNYPGITVDKKTGWFEVNGTNYELIDVPGTYSIKHKSEDEKVALDVIIDPNNDHYPDFLIYVADATNLKRSLLFFSQIVDKKIPTLFALNMSDLAKAAGIHIDTTKLEKELGVPVVAINARHSEGIDELKTSFQNALDAEKNSAIPFLSVIPDDYKQDLLDRYQKINSILNNVVTANGNLPEGLSKLDQFVTHKLWGALFFAVVLFTIFQSVFMLAQYPMEWIETLFGVFDGYVNEHMAEGMLRDLTKDGILAGLSGVLIFIPQIALLFFFVGILEDSGYMARVSFMMDSMLRKFGLHGKSIIPLMSGAACAIPAVMSARTISNSKERLITILVTPLMTCSARLPVYVLIISMIIPEGNLFGIMNYQGLSMMILYVLGFVMSLLVAYVLKLILKSEERSFFILEMPTYKLPRWKNIFLTMYEKVKVFVFDAGKIIISISVILWLLSSYGPSDKFEQLDKQYEAGELTELEMNSKKLESSYVGILGKSIEPAIKPMGFDWKIGISLLTSFAAREVFVGSMATIYSVGDEEDTASIKQKMMRATHPDTGEKVYTFGVGLALLMFYAFAMQCMSTLAIVYRETKSIKWPIIQFVYMTAIAYFSATICYQIFG